MVSLLSLKTPLHTMTTKYVSADPQESAARLSRRARNLAKVYTTLKSLEACVAACEVLADELGPESYTDPLHADINEAIVACETLMSASVRQSPFSMQYADLAVASLNNLILACEGAPARTALQCSARCSDCVSILRDEFLRTISN